MASKVLIIDDDADILAFVSEALTSRNYEVRACNDSREAAAAFVSFCPDVCLIDFRMPHMTGSDLLDEFKQIDSSAEIIFLTGENETVLAVDLMKRGAIDYLLKPVDLYQLDAALDRALEHRRLVKENMAYKVRIERMLVQEAEAHRLLRQLLGRYVSEDVAAQLAADPARHLRPGGEKREATVLFADVRGFTSLAETADPMQAVEILNVCLSNAVDAVFEFGGTVDKFLGDGIMALFGAPVRHEDDPYRAVCCALRIREKLENLKFEHLGDVRLYVGMGINTGVVIAGTIGSEKRMDYTVIGDAVNVAQRLESMAGPGQILIAASTYGHVKSRVHVRRLGGLRVRGKSAPVVAFEVTGAKADLIATY